MNLKFTLKYKRTFYDVIYLCKKKDIKTAFALFMLMTFALRPAYQASYYLYFKLNMDAIVAKYCVNKERPQLKCNGKCHLGKTISFTADKDTTNSNSKSVQLSNAFYPLYFQSPDQFSWKQGVFLKSTDNFAYHNSYSFTSYWNYKPPPRYFS
jgi:hypothetical protein